MSKHYKPKEFAELLNVSVITYEQYLEYTGIYKETDSRKIVIYTQVSTSDPKGDLKN